MATIYEYHTAMRELLDANAELKHLAAQLRSFTERLLAFPQETCFATVAGEPAPPLSQLVGGAHWHVEDFPTPERLQASLRRRHDARQKAFKMWEGLTDAQRRGAAPVPA